MKGIYNSAAFIDSSGVQVGALAQVTVRREDNDQLATLYADKDGLVSLSNPFNADSEGRFFFHADGIAGGYRVTVFAGGQTTTVRYQALGTARYYDVNDITPFAVTLLDDPDAATMRATLGVSIGSGVQAWDADLDALAALSTTGIIVRTGSGTATTRSITGTTNRITVTNGDGVSGNINISAPQDIHSGATPSFAQVALAGDPSTALQAATKQYVDNAIAGLDPKQSCRVKTTANVSLSGGGIANGTSIDGVTLATGDRVLVASQTAPAENGIYIAPASGAASRATDMDSWTEVPGAIVAVEQGTASADTIWLSTADQGGTLNTTAITFSLLGLGSFQPLDSDLTAVAGLSTTGLIVRTGSGTATTRSIANGNGIAALTNADGVSGNPTIAVDFSGGAGAALAATASAGAATSVARSDHSHQRQLECLIVACSDETTALTAGTSKIKFRMPYAFTLTAVRASLSTAQATNGAGGIFTVDINESGTSVLSTKLTIDNTELTSQTAATAAVISDSAIADDAEMSVDIDQIGDGTAKGLKIVLIGRQSA